MPTQTKTPKNFWLVVTAAGLLILLLALYMIWSAATGTNAEDQAFDERTRNAQQSMEELEAALAADTYGGKTPEETLQLFIGALKKGDINLASKYFTLDTNTQSPDYLTHRKWEEGLRQAQTNNQISEIINDVPKFTLSNRNTGTNQMIEFVITDDKGDVERNITFRLNEQSQVWKIESL